MFSKNGSSGRKREFITPHSGKHREQTAMSPQAAESPSAGPTSYASPDPKPPPTITQNYTHGAPSGASQTMPASFVASQLTESDDDDLSSPYRPDDGLATEHRTPSTPKVNNNTSKLTTPAPQSDTDVEQFLKPQLSLSITGREEIPADRMSMVSASGSGSFTPPEAPLDDLKENSLPGGEQNDYMDYEEDFGLAAGSRSDLFPAASSAVAVPAWRSAVAADKDMTEDFDWTLNPDVKSLETSASILGEDDLEMRGCNISPTSVPNSSIEECNAHAMEVEMSLTPSSDTQPGLHLEVCQTQDLVPAISDQQRDIVIREDYYRLFPNGWANRITEMKQVLLTYEDYQCHFPYGHVIFDTPDSGTELKCGIHSLMNGIALEFEPTKLPTPSLEALEWIATQGETAVRYREALPEDEAVPQNSFSFDQLAGTLADYGRLYGLEVQLGVYRGGEDTYRYKLDNPDATLWIAHNGRFHYTAIMALPSRARYPGCDTSGIFDFWGPLQQSFPGRPAIDTYATPAMQSTAIAQPLREERPLQLTNQLELAPASSSMVDIETYDSGAAFAEPPIDWEGYSNEVEMDSSGETVKSRNLATSFTILSGHVLASSTITFETSQVATGDSQGSVAAAAPVSAMKDQNRIVSVPLQSSYITIVAAVDEQPGIEYPAEQSSEVNFVTSAGQICHNSVQQPHSFDISAFHGAANISEETTAPGVVTQSPVTTVGAAVYEHLIAGDPVQQNDELNLVTPCDDPRRSLEERDIPVDTITAQDTTIFPEEASTPELLSASEAPLYQSTTAVTDCQITSSSDIVLLVAPMHELPESQTSRETTAEIVEHSDVAVVPSAEVADDRDFLNRDTINEKPTGNMGVVGGSKADDLGFSGANIEHLPPMHAMQAEERSLFNRHDVQEPALPAPSTMINVRARHNESEQQPDSPIVDCLVVGDASPDVRNELRIAQYTNRDLQQQLATAIARIAGLEDRDQKQNASIENFKKDKKKHKAENSKLETQAVQQAAHIEALEKDKKDSAARESELLLKNKQLKRDLEAQSRAADQSRLLLKQYKGKAEAEEAQADLEKHFDEPSLELPRLSRARPSSAALVSCHDNSPSDFLNTVRREESARNLPNVVARAPAPALSSMEDRGTQTEVNITRITITSGIQHTSPMSSNVDLAPGIPAQYTGAETQTENDAPNVETAPSPLNTEASRVSSGAPQSAEFGTGQDLMPANIESHSAARTPRSSSGSQAPSSSGGSSAKAAGKIDSSHSGTDRTSNLPLPNAVDGADSSGASSGDSPSPEAAGTSDTDGNEVEAAAEANDVATDPPEPDPDAPGGSVGGIPHARRKTSHCWKRILFILLMLGALSYVLVIGLSSSKNETPTERSTPYFGDLMESLACDNDLDDFIRFPNVVYQIPDTCPNDLPGQIRFPNIMIRDLVCYKTDTPLLDDPPPRPNFLARNLPTWLYKPPLHPPSPSSWLPCKPRLITVTPGNECFQPIEKWEPVWVTQRDIATAWAAYVYESTEFAAITDRRPGIILLKGSALFATLFLKNL